MLSADVLEQLRLLTNLETNERKLLQIVLIGQPELRTMLERPELEQLAQRVIARFHLERAVGEGNRALHPPSPLGRRHDARDPVRPQGAAAHPRAPRGVPRRINLLCDRVMLGAYAHGRHSIDIAIVEKARSEVFGRSTATSRTASASAAPPACGLVRGAGLALTALLGFALYGGWRQFAAPTSLATASAPRAPARIRERARGGTAPAGRRGPLRRPHAAAAVGDRGERRWRASSPGRGPERDHRHRHAGRDRRTGAAPSAPRACSTRGPRRATGGHPRHRSMRSRSGRARRRREDRLARAAADVGHRRLQRRSLRRRRRQQVRCCDSARRCRW